MSRTGPIWWTTEGGDAATIGLNGVTLATARTSNSFSLEGYNQLAIYVDLTRTAATTVDIYLEYSDDDGTTWFRSQASSVAAGTETITDHLIQKTVAADDTFVHFMEVFGKLGRLVVDGTSGGASDTIIVDLHFGVSGVNNA